MTVNANVRCIEWLNTDNTIPTDSRLVLGYYMDDLILPCRLNGDEWQLCFSGELTLECARPTHWCEFPEGPSTPGDPLAMKNEPEYQAELKWARDMVSKVIIPSAPKTKGDQ